MTVLKACTIAVLFIAACAPAEDRGTDEPGVQQPGPPRAGAECDPAAARRTIEQLGTRLRGVSLLAPDSVLGRELRSSYAPLAAPDLIDAWLADPSTAPGRQVSSPWPRAIEVTAVRRGETGGCVVDGYILLVTSADTTTAVSRESVRFTVTAAGTQITAYEQQGEASPVAVISDYYDAIRARDYRGAYALWGDGGAASGQTYDEFAAGFADTETVDVDVGEPGATGAATGSRYVEIPVVITAITEAGERQRFAGTYTLRRSVVDGATPEQRRWHIYSADITQQ